MKKVNFVVSVVLSVTLSLAIPFMSLAAESEAVEVPNVVQSAVDGDGIISREEVCTKTWSSSSLKINGNYTMHTFTIPAGKFNISSDSVMTIDEMEMQTSFVPEGSYYNFSSSGSTNFINGSYYDTSSNGVSTVSESFNATVTGDSVTGHIEFPTYNGTISMDDTSISTSTNASGQTTYSFVGHYSYSEDIVVDSGIVGGDFARITYGNIFQKPAMIGACTRVDSKGYIDVHDGNLYPVYEGWGVLTTGAIANDKLRYVEEVEFVVVVTPSSSDSVTFGFYIPCRTYSLTVRQFHEYYDASRLFSDVDSGTSDSFQGSLGEFDDIQNTVVFDNVATLEDYSFDAATGQITKGSSLYNAIAFCTSYMTGMFNQSVFGEVFYVIAGLAFGCLLIGYARMWRAPTDFGSRKGGKK